MTDPTPTYVPIAGLKVPAELVPQIVAAMRWQYPAETDGKTDNAAVKAALRAMVKDLLSRYALAVGVEQVEVEVKNTRQQYEEAARQSRQQALDAADTILEQ